MRDVDGHKPEQRGPDEGIAVQDGGGTRQQVELVLVARALVGGVEDAGERGAKEERKNGRGADPEGPVQIGHDVGRSRGLGVVGGVVNVVGAE